LLREYVVLELDDITIIGQLFLPDTKNRYPVVCLCHGIPSGNPPDPEDGGYPLLAEQICREGFAVFIFNFRGTGDSGGNLDILGWTRDLQAVINYLCEIDGSEKSGIALIGFSAGAAVSVYCGSRDERVARVAACACPADFSLILEGNGWQSYIDRFRKIGAIVDDDFPSSVEEWLNNFREVTPVDHIDNISPRQLLLVHGDMDETVPVSHAHRLFEKAGEPKKLVIIEGAGHRLRQDERVVGTLLDWLKSQ